MKISSKQKLAICRMNKRLNILDGSVRSGKTIGSLLKWIEFVFYGPKGNLMMIGKTERTLKRNIIDLLQEMLPNSISYNQGKGELYIGNRKIYIAGAADEKAESKIRGISLAGIYGDELTLWPESLFKMCLSRLSIDGAQFFGTTNPDSPYHWFKQDILNNSDLNLSCIHFTLDDNPFLGKEFKDNLKKEYAGIWYQRFILGQWVMADGVVYDMFNLVEHIQTFPIDKFTNYIVGVDYGTNNPCTFGLYGFNDNQKVYLCSEYYYDSTKNRKQKTDSEYASDFVEWLNRLSVQSIKKIYIDPSALSFILELRRKGLDAYIKKANNEVLDGIRFVGSKIIRNEFIIHSSCKETAREFLSYVWDSKAQKQGIDKPLKESDHCMDRNRYALFSHFGRRKLAGVLR